MDKRIVCLVTNPRRVGAWLHAPDGDGGGHRALERDTEVREVLQGAVVPWPLAS